MDLNELNKAMKDLGQPESERTEEKLQAMIDKYDLNGDGTLSYEEFLIMMNWGPLPEEKPAPAPAPAAPADPAKKGGDGAAAKTAPAPAAKPAAPADAGKDAGKKATDCQKLSDAAATCKANKEKKEAEDEAKKEEEKTKEEDKAKKEADKTK